MTYLLDLGHLAARDMPGEREKQRVQIRVGTGQVALDAAETPLLTPTQAHYRMVTSAAGEYLPRQG